MDNVNRWIEFPSTGRRATERAVCVPYAGGSSSVFRRLAAQLPETVEFGAVQLPGRWNRRTEPFATDVGNVAAVLAKEIAGRPIRPSILLGYSLGALIAFETARLLFAESPQHAPCALIVAASCPPHRQRKENLHRLPDEQFLTAMMERYPEGIPRALLDDQEALDMLLPILKADVALFETYRYAPAQLLPCRIISVSGSGDTLNSAAVMGGWRTLTCGTFSQETVNGGHFFINEQSARLAATVLAALRTGGRGGASSVCSCAPVKIGKAL